MTKPLTKYEAIETVLKQGHASQTSVEPNDQWRRQIMQAVLKHRLPPVLDNSRIWVEHLIWRSALAAASVALILVTYIATTDLGMEPLALQLLFADPGASQASRMLALLTLFSL